MVCAIAAGSCASTAGSSDALPGGDDSRTVNALLKLKNGGELTFAAIGGSITQGGCVNGVNDWLQGKAAESGGKVTYVNAGIGASDSGLGCLRIQDHVLRHDPDILVVEYAVNDSYFYDAPTNNRTYESLVRQALKDSGRAVYLLLMHTDQQGAAKFNPTHAPQRAVGNNYQLPVFRWMDFEKSVKNWLASGFLPDGTHPNAEGNASVSRGITAYLDKIWDTLPDEPIAVNAALPPPKYFGDYEKISFIKWGDEGVAPGGWTEAASLLPDSWARLSSDLKGVSGFKTNSADELTIKFRGKSVYIISTYTDKGVSHGGPSSADGGKAWVEKAGGGNTPRKNVSCLSWWSGPEWFGTHIADGLDAAQEHTLHITGVKNGAVNVWGAIVGIDP
ncbi:MAG: SGNH/GDSL hydrolase family protein [Treponema sp.]|nr:SGNH/GDSL hydrolase family protein [Treponema sp.]